MICQWPTTTDDENFNGWAPDGMDVVRFWRALQLDKNGCALPRLATTSPGSLGLEGSDGRWWLA
eukprot:9691960-Alexandrium_andersonii.AAC.1